MYFAAQACVPLLEGAAGKALDAIQAEFGRKCLTKGYSKLYHMCRTCTKVSTLSKLSATELVAFVLEGLLFELRYELTSVEKLTEIHLCGARNLAGKVGVLLWKRMLVQYLFDNVVEASANAGDGFADEMNDLIMHFKSYVEFGSHFQDSPYALASAQGDETSACKFDGWKQGKRKMILIPGLSRLSKVSKE